MKLGQSSIESLLIAAMGLTLVIFAFYFAASSGASVADISAAKNAVDTLARSVDALFSQGPLAKDTAEIYLPGSVESINISGNRILISIRTQSGTNDIYSTTNANLSGSIPANPGRQSVPISVLASGRVVIGSTALSCAPSSISTTLAPGTSSGSSISVANPNDIPVSGISSSESGAAAALFASGAPNSTIAPGGTSVVQVNFTIPPSQASGQYAGAVSIGDGGSNTCDTEIAVFVTDNSGPVASNIAFSPPSPNATSQITINATGTDNAGGSGVALCQLAINSPANWNQMSIYGGSPGASQVNATYSAGSLPPGDYTIYIRCMDLFGNIGATANASIFVNSSAPPPSGPSLFFYDTFTDGNKLLTLHAPDVGTGWFTGWSTRAGAVGFINANRGTFQASGSNRGFASIANGSNISSPDYNVTMRVVGLGGGSNTVSAIARWQDNSTYYVYTFSSSSGAGRNYIAKKVANTWTSLNTSCGSVAAPSTVVFKVNGTLLQAYDDGALECRANDSSIGAAGFGGFGMGYLRTATDDLGGGFIDNFNITSN